MSIFRVFVMYSLAVYLTIHKLMRLRYFSRASAVALIFFLQFLAVSAAPIVIPRATQSPSYASLPSPVISPYYVYFGNPNTTSLADAFPSVNLTAATIGFASAPKGQVRGCSCGLGQTFSHIPS
jgi:hypothetical protein